MWLAVSGMWSRKAPSPLGYSSYQTSEGGRLFPEKWGCRSSRGVETCRLPGGKRALTSETLGDGRLYLFRLREGVPEKSSIGHGGVV